MVGSTDVGQGRHSGSVIALTTLSPVRDERHGKLARRLGLVALVPALGRPLAELAFIHYARWTVLKAVPGPDGSGAPRQLNSRYLLFESNYNGSLGDYLDTFTAVIPHRLARLWGTCREFEETVERADGAEVRRFPPWAFRRYVARNELEVLHFHAAYPEATMIDVRQALAVAERRVRARTLRDGDLEDAVRRTVPLVIGPAPEQLERREACKRFLTAQLSALTRRYGVNPFTLLAPVDPGAADALFDRLRGWPADGGPLSALTDTHYARLVRVPPDLKDLGQSPPDDLGMPYLLYTSNHCGSARDHIDRLRGQLGPVADQIWEHSPRYPGHADPAFADWAKRHTIDTRYFVAGYAPHEPETVRKALAERRRMEQKLWDKGPSPAWLKGDGA